MRPIKPIELPTVDFFIDQVVFCKSKQNLSLSQYILFIFRQLAYVVRYIF